MHCDLLYKQTLKLPIASTVKQGLPMLPMFATVWINILLLLLANFIHARPQAYDAIHMMHDFRTSNQCNMFCERLREHITQFISATRFVNVYVNIPYNTIFFYSFPDWASNLQSRNETYSTVAMAEPLPKKPRRSLLPVLQEIWSLGNIIAAIIFPRKFYRRALIFPRKYYRRQEIWSLTEN